MTFPRPSKKITTAIALGLGLGVPALAHGQTNPGNANLSTGSGAGTSPGVAPGSSPSGTNIDSGRPGTPAANLGPQKPFNPGGGIDQDTGLPAALEMPPLRGLSQAEIDEIDARLLDDVRRIENPADRSMAMERVAFSKIASHQPGDRRLEDAEIAIREGGIAALNVKDRVTRDIRLTNIVRAGLALADEQNREAKTDSNETGIAPDANAKPWTARRRYDWLLKAETQRKAAGELAVKIDNATLRGEMLFHVVDETSAGSQEIVQEALLVDGKRADLKGMTDMIERMGDRGLVFAANTAERIDKPIWRDRAMISIAIAASASDQFERGIEISRTIPQPEYRSDALIRLAESQARRNLSAQATRTYTEAAAAVASIPLEDPRATLASVLIDSLISVGRFDDARECVPFFPDDVRKLNALGTIAQNQGERRLAKSAFEWIERDAPPQLRDNLKLRVTTGVLKSFERNRNLTPASGTGGY